MGRVRCQLFGKHLPILPDKLAKSFLAMAVVQHLSTPGRLWRCAGAAGDDVVVLVGIVAFLFSHYMLLSGALRTFFN